jgi:hypothetical protein
MTGWQWVMNCWELRWKWSLPYIRYADSCLIAKVAQILGILNNTFRPFSVQKSWRIKLYIMQWLPPCFYMEEKSGLSVERIKKNKDWHQSRRNFVRVESRASWRESKMIQIKLTTTCNNNRMTKVMLNYRPSGRRRLGRTLKRLLVQALFLLL